MKNEVANLRINYTKQVLFEKDMHENPLEQFGIWFLQAKENGILEPNAMILSTLDGDKPVSRVLLLKGWDTRGFIFYTNYGSSKGKQIAQNPNAAMTFFWDKEERQIRIEGVLEKIPEKESDEYFLSRPHGSKVGAWVSEQSSVVAGREILEQKLLEFNEKFPEGSVVPRPDFWGGYVLRPQSVEFWQGRPNRLHDRLKYLKNENHWEMVRLSP